MMKAKTYCLVPVPGSNVANVLPVVLGMIVRGCQEINDFKYEDAVHWINTGQVQLWVGRNTPASVDSVLLAVNKPEKVDILLWAGKMPSSWDAAWDCVKDVAKHYGKKKVSIRGRKGFMKVFKKYGMREKFTVMECEIDDN